MPSLEIINQQLKKIESIVNDERPAKTPPVFHAGVDLGTTDIVLLVTDDEGNPISAFLEWAEVVRDGIVLDYWGATQIVKELLRKTEQKLNIKIERAITSFPPGTDPKTSENVIRAAGLEIEAIIDEPSSVVRLLEIENGAVVDIGGGTTGIAVAKNSKIVYSADEPTGGRHVSLTIAGSRKISFDDAEKLKRNGAAASLLPIVQPVFEKMADIIGKHISGQNVKTIYLSGGTCCFPGIDQVLQDELADLEIVHPHNPLYLTPLAISSYRIKQEA
jgi:ethanolamine utilization protein EutJ